MKPEDWEAYLIETHHRAPGMSPEAFAHLKNSDGHNSYEELVHKISGSPTTILDLACGDGYLVEKLAHRFPQSKYIGLDMSEGELAVARERNIPSAVEWIHGRAQALPLGDNSVEVITCHMAFMLMQPIEPVLKEIARVLKLGGKFMSVIGSPENAGSFDEEVRKVMSGFFMEHIPEIKNVVTGDKRVKTKEELSGLLKPVGLTLETVEDQNFETTGTPEEFWQITKNMYFIDLLSPSHRSALKQCILDLAKNHADSSGELTFGYRRRFLTIVI